MQTQTAEHIFPFTEIRLHPKLVRVEALSDEIGELTGYLNAANCRLLELIAEFYELKGWVHEGAKSCAHWLNWKCGLGYNAARERIRTARALTGLPQIHAAFKAGRISYSKVRAMTRVATPANEAYLVEVAIYGTATHVEKLVRGYRWVIAREEEREQDNRRRDGRYCRYCWDADGCLVVSARLSPEQGALFIKALEAGEREVERDTARQDAIDRSEAAGVTAVTLPYQERPHKRADALEMMAESFLASGPAALAGGSKHEILLIAGQTVLAGNSIAGECRIDEGPVVGVDTMRRLCCDAAIRPVTMDPHGEPLDIGRRSRTIPRRPDFGVHIDKNTSACLWDGLPGDYSASVAGLQIMDGRPLF